MNVALEDDATTSGLQLCPLLYMNWGFVFNNFQLVFDGRFSAPITVTTPIKILTMEKCNHLDSEHVQWHTVVVVVQSQKRCVYSAP